MTATPDTSVPALYFSVSPLGESDAMVSCFTPIDGALAIKARGLRKPQSKLAHLLLPADELRLRLARSRGPSPILTGVSLHRVHPEWREDLGLLAFYWFMIECAFVGSGGQEANADVFRLVVNLVRSMPTSELRHGAAAVFGLKLLMLHGLLPDLEHCAIDGHRLSAGEPVHLLPSGEGVVGREAYNRHYARTGGGMLQLAPQRFARWRSLRSGSLLDYASLGTDSIDAALLVHYTARLIADTAGRPVRSAQFLAKQWELADVLELQRHADI